MGKGVYKLSRSSDNTYTLHTGHEAKEVSVKDFSEYDKIFRGNKYIVQNYVNSLTKAGNPFDVKIYLIRSGKDGNFNQLNPLPRLGSSLGIVSNVAYNEGGNVLLYTDKFFEEQFGENWEKVRYEMDKLIELVPKALQRGYGRPLNSLGLDIGFDMKTNMPKLFEVNGTINSTPNKMEMCAEQALMYKQLYREILKNGNVKSQNHFSVGGNQIYFDNYCPDPSKKEKNREGRHIVVLGELAEKDFAQLLYNMNIDIIIYCSCQQQTIVDVSKNQLSIEIIYTSSINEAARQLFQIVGSYDIILFKGYHPSGIEIIADKVFGTNFYINLRGKRFKKRVTTSNYVATAYIDTNFISIRKYTGNKKILQMPSFIKGFSIERVGKMAFAENECITKVVFSSTIVRIGWRAFYNCTELRLVELPTCLRIIGKGVFGNCVELRKVRLPSRVIEIGSKAFSGCEKLSEIWIPPSTLTIAADVFEGCDKLKIIGEGNSHAQNYAELNGIQFLTYSQYKLLRIKRKIKMKLQWNG